MRNTMNSIFRSGRPAALLMAVLLTVLTIPAVAVHAQGESGDENVPLAPPTFEELSRTLNLDAEQIETLRPAYLECFDNFQGRGQFRGNGQRSGMRDGDSPRFQGWGGGRGMQRPGMGAGRAYCGNRSGKRAFRPNGSNVPRMEFLEKAADVLSGDQFNLLLKDMQVRRDVHRDRMVEMRTEYMRVNAQERLESMTGLLGLSEDQQADWKSLHEQYLARVKNFYEERKDQDFSPIEHRAKRQKLREEFHASVLNILDDGQKERFQLLQDVMPGFGQHPVGRRGGRGSRMGGGGMGRF